MCKGVPQLCITAKWVHDNKTRQEGSTGGGDHFITELHLHILFLVQISLTTYTVVLWWEMRLKLKAVLRIIMSTKNEKRGRSSTDKSFEISFCSTSVRALAQKFNPRISCNDCILCKLRYLFQKVQSVYFCDCNCNWSKKEKKRLIYRYLFYSHYTPQVFFFLFHNSTALIRRPMFITFR